MTEHTTQRDERETRTSDRAAGSDDPANDDGGRDRTADAPDAGESAPLERRDYLRSVGAVGAAGLLGGLGLGAGAAGGVAAQEDWEAQADERIQEHRTGDLEVVVRNESGDPISDAEVRVEMQEHDFGFGTAVHAEFLTRGSEWGNDIHTDEDRQRYREAIEEHFNMLVLENVHKWYLWEENTEIADEAVQWALDRDMDVRGHVALWGNVGAWAIPPRVVEAMGDPWASEWDEAGQPNPDPDYVVEESMNHIEEIITYYGDDITEWEVVNEVFHEPAMIEAIEGQGVEPTTAPILGDWYEHAQSIADQYGVGIAVNDYNTLAGGYTNEWDQYETQIDYLVNQRGIDLDGIGMQSHHYADEQLDPGQMWDGLERYAQYGAGLRITEFDMFGNGWTRQEQADYLHQFLKLFFSHPAAEDFLMWGIWDPIHWGDDLNNGTKDAPLYEDDWTEKPAYDEYVGLVFDEWWTDETGRTDSSGTYATAAFLGEHEITVTTDEETTTTTVEVTDADGTTTVEVTVDGEGNGGDPESPPEIDGNQPADSDGDGLYDDVNGDGATTTSDVTTFFENIENPAVSDYPEYYDFDGSGSVSISDVIELFESL